ncbi:MAG: winged helix-turn-helix transcriptional regulator [Actinomycetia bacterium]|nr:winged helix-turn-helix transcriptional regulator [Actinomycetes bacterium]
MSGDLTTATTTAGAMRSYDQFCPVARGLDKIGGRWTILIVRELLLSPRRYSDLEAGLPGVTPNVLADRLRDLQAAGIVRRSKLPPPGVAVVYELTELGEGLRPVVDALTRWGLQLLDAPQPRDSFRLDWLLGCLRASFRPELTSGVRESYEFRVDEAVFHIRIDGAEIDVRHGPAADRACAISADLSALLAVGAQLLELDDAEKQGVVQVEGSRSAAVRAITILGPHLEATGGQHGIIGAVRARFQPGATRALQESYEFRIDGLVFHALVNDGSVQMAVGPADEPAATLSTDLATLLGLGAGTINFEQSLTGPRGSLTGEPEARRRMAAAFGVRGAATRSPSPPARSI